MTTHLSFLEGEEAMGVQHAPLVPQRTLESSDFRQLFGRHHHEPFLRARPLPGQARHFVLAAPVAVSPLPVRPDGLPLGSRSVEHFLGLEPAKRSSELDHSIGANSYAHVLTPYYAQRRPSIVVVDLSGFDVALHARWSLGYRRSTRVFFEGGRGGNISASTRNVVVCRGGEVRVEVFVLLCTLAASPLHPSRTDEVIANGEQRPGVP